MYSISYINFNQLSTTPYIVINFNCNSTTHDTTCVVKIAGEYINAETDMTVELNLCKFPTDPNLTYYIPKNRFSVNSYGHKQQNGKYVQIHVYAHDKRNETPISRRDPHQWEFDKQAKMDDMCGGSSIQSLNTLVWEAIDVFIMNTADDNYRENKRKLTTYIGSK